MWAAGDGEELQLLSAFVRSRVVNQSGYSPTLTKPDLTRYGFGLMLRLPGPSNGMYVSTLA